MIDRATVDKIFSAADIVEVISDFLPLKKRGANYTACCPFHDEKTPSFSVSPAKGIFKCFGCGKAGNAVTFVQLHENMTYAEALKYVAKKYHIEVVDHAQTEEEKRQNDDRESMMVVTDFAQKFFSNALENTDEGRAYGLSYFKERGFSETTIKKFQLGYCPSKWNAFASEALSKGYKKEFLLKTGLCYQKEQTGELGDFYTGRVIFPIHSISGRPIAFGGRVLNSATKGVKVKYKNSPESEIYIKNRILYGMHLAKGAIVKKQNCYLVEGYTDVISMVQAGVDNVVASCGTSLTPEQVKQIRKFTPNVTVLYDGDDAGIHASIRGIDMLLEEDLSVKVILLPDGEDPDSFARSHSASEVEQFLNDKEQDFIIFKSNLLLNEAKNDPAKKAGLIINVIQSVAVIPNNITRMVYVKEVARMFNMDENIISNEVRKARANKYLGKEYRGVVEQTANRVLPQRNATEKKRKEISCDEHEREMMYYLLKFGSRALFKNDRGGTDTVAQYIISELKNNEIELQNPLYKKILAEYEYLLSQPSDFSIKQFVQNPDEEVSQFAVAVESNEYQLSSIWKKQGAFKQEEDNFDLEKIIPRIVIIYKCKILEQYIVKFNAQLKESKESGDTEKSTLILQNIMLLNKRRQIASKELERIVI